LGDHCCTKLIPERIIPSGFDGTFFSIAILFRGLHMAQAKPANINIWGVFEGVARGLGCAPGSPFLCLASSSPPSARPARAKSPPPPPLVSRGTPFSTVALGLGSARRWAGDFRAQSASGGWPWRAHAGEGKHPLALLRHENHGL
jgi:hypothetical protein